MRKKIVVFSAYVADKFNAATGCMHLVALCNILAKKYDVTLACFNNAVETYMPILPDNVKLVPIVRKQFMPSIYIVNQREIEDFCKKLQCDAAIVYFSPHVKYIKMYMKQKYAGNSLIHVRINVLAKNMLATSFTYHLMKCAKKSAMLRLFDYWAVADYDKFIGRPVRIYGLYEDGNFKNKFKHDDISADIKYLPEMDYVKFSLENVKVPEEKNRLFTFGFVLGGDTRDTKDDIYDFCFEKLYDDPASKIYVHRKYKDKNGKKYNSLLQPSKYYAAIAQSKFTFIIPSTVTTEVSVLRVNEAIRRKCIPLFHPANNIDKVYSKSDCAFIRSHLMFDPNKYSTVNDFVKKLDKEYDDLLAEVLQLDFVKKGFSLTEDDVLKIIEKELEG